MVNEARSAPYRGSDYLGTPEDVQDYLNAALEDGDERVLLQALRNVADGLGGGTRLSEQTGLEREVLDSALSEPGNQGLASLLAVLKAFGLELSVRVRRDAA